MAPASTVALLATLLLASAAVAPVLGAPSAAAESMSSASGSITVAATTDYAFQPNTFQLIPTNATITVTFTDEDVLQHSFTISSREGVQIPSTYTPAQLDQWFVTYPALYTSLLNGTGEQSVGEFTSPATAGWYEFVCTVSGHFQNGMYGFIAFGENLPSNLTTPARVGIVGTTGNPYEAGAVAAVVVAGVVVFLWWRRRRERPTPIEEPASSGPTGRPDR
ncbi:MAG: sulfocyanin-like copper-binding protein [Thermoplasmata archaeon]